jgi:hypothetical protein
MLLLLLLKGMVGGTSGARQRIECIDDIISQLAVMIYATASSIAAASRLRFFGFGSTFNAMMTSCASLRLCSLTLSERLRDTPSAVHWLGQFEL